MKYIFSNSHVWMWKLDHKESWAPKNWCFWIVVLERIRESPLDCKEIQPVNLKGNQSSIFTGRTDAEAPILWPPDAKNWLLRKDPDAGKDWRWEEKGMTEDEMVGWHHWLDGVWVSSRSWWWTGRPGVLQSMGSQRVGHNWATEQQQSLSGQADPGTQASKAWTAAHSPESWVGPATQTQTCLQEVKVP